MKEIFGDHVSSTLLLPIIGRSVVTQEYPRYFDFANSKDIFGYINKEFSIDSKNLNGTIKGFAALTYGLRYKANVKACFDYMKDHPNCTIVNIGCGLDDLFPDVDNGKIQFYNLDLPDVIDLRKSIFEKREREYQLSKSFLDHSIVEDIRFSPEDGILFLMAGVIYYFTPKKMEGFFRYLGNHYPGARLVYDSESPFLMKQSNYLVKKQGIQGAEMKFLVYNPSSVKHWDHRITNISINYDFSSFLKDTKDIPFKFKFMFYVLKIIKGMYLVTIDYSLY
ncbi:MAG: class I SAM-dependent methyltransferase [Tissierellia bacterium]|nr:class I SAM-dependent methyltransferase [Tissierellia bacterium]